MNYYRQNLYDRIKAVDYAKKYALTPNPSFKYFVDYETYGGDCTNFISQCLFAGGAPMSYITEYAWWYRKSSSVSTQNDTWSIAWSIAWAVAHSLYWSLKVNKERNYKGPKGQEVKSVNELELGDIISYENDKGIIYHTAIVTSFGSAGPLISQHTFNALNIPYLKTWKAKQMHFVKISI